MTGIAPDLLDVEAVDQIVYLAQIELIGICKLLNGGRKGVDPGSDLRDQILDAGDDLRDNDLNQHRQDRQHKCVGHEHSDQSGSPPPELSARELCENLFTGF